MLFVKHCLDFFLRQESIISVVPTVLVLLVSLVGNINASAAITVWEDAFARLKFVCIGFFWRNVAATFMLLLHVRTRAIFFSRVIILDLSELWVPGFLLFVVGIDEPIEEVLTLALNFLQLLMVMIMIMIFVAVIFVLLLVGCNH